jgi:uncharacterized protein
MAEAAPALETPIYSARPRLEVAGAEDAIAGNLLQQMEMREAEGGLSSLELRFSNSAEIEGGGQNGAARSRLDGQRHGQLGLADPIGARDARRAAPLHHAAAAPVRWH